MSGSSLRSKGTAASTSTSDPESDEEMGHRLLHHHGLHLLFLSNSPTFTNPWKTTLFFNVGPWIVQPMAHPEPCAAVPQWSSLTVWIARHLWRLAILPAGPHLQQRTSG
ncbi:hypothetical protein B0H13DRAFT_2371587 [Mycena leptocephala]|nr:hypothetical protein B0H13DRAFT_2371587 [Mycena leptocephala]